MHECISVSMGNMASNIDRATKIDNVVQHGVDVDIMVNRQHLIHLKSSLIARCKGHKQ